MKTTQSIKTALLTAAIMLAGSVSAQDSVTQDDDAQPCAFQQQGNQTSPSG